MDVKLQKPMNYTYFNVDQFRFYQRGGRREDNWKWGSEYRSYVFRRVFLSLSSSN